MPSILVPGLAVLAVLAVLAPAACMGQQAAPRLVQWSEIAALPVSPAQHRIAYGPDSLQFGDLRLPDSDGPHPVVVLIHGGCWRSQFDLDYMSHAAVSLRDAGVATWTIEFRRVGNAGGGWPGTFDDVRAAVDHLATLGERFPLDLQRVVLAGHSAGGHLALWIASDRRAMHLTPVATEAMRIRGVVSLAGITDLRAYAGDQGCNAAVPLLLGGSARDHPDRYATASPIERVPLGVPMILIQGALDPIVPVTQASAFSAAATSAGDDARVVLLDDAGHFDLVLPSAPAWRAVERVLLELLGATR